MVFLRAGPGFHWSTEKAVLVSLESQHSQQAKAFLSPWTGCDIKERDVVREKRKRSVSDRPMFRKKI